MACKPGSDIALEDPEAAAGVVRRVFAHVEQLAEHPDSGSWPPELGRGRHRRIVEPPYRFFCRHDGHKIFVLHVMRAERLLRERQLGGRSRRPRD